MKGYLVINGFLGSEKYTQIYDKLKQAFLKVDIFLEEKTSAELSTQIDLFSSKISLPDFVLFWDKDVNLAKRLESLGLKVFNSAKAIEACDNKAITYIELEKNAIKTPKTIIAPKTFEGVGYNDLSFLHQAVNVLGLPIVIKEAYGSFGKQVYLAKTLLEAEQIVKNLGYKEFIMQEFVSSSKGRDVRINVVGDKVVCSMLRSNENDFRSNITNGGKAKEFIPSKAQSEIALRATSALGLDFAGVDVLFGENDQPIVCEVNSNPHFKSSLDATGVDLSEYIAQHVKGKLQ